ncbi:MAG: carbohydrate ABC transporter permease [Alphaproteobacteria bacterium]|nr:carbohydrate ABC transporter permease [Alphaproteobacteria bacterium]
MLRRRYQVGSAGWRRSAVCTVVGLIYFLPVLWIILTAFKTPRDALTPSILFTPTLDNFSAVFRRAYYQGGEVEDTQFGLFFFNSILLAGVSVGLALILGTVAAYAFSRWPLKGNDTYLFIILATRMLPPIIVIIPLFVMFRLTGLSGGYLGILLLYTAFNLPFTIWIMKSFFDELPRDVEDAARTEGSSEWRVFFRICLPQVKAGIAATVTFGLILTWNEFIMALLMTGSQTRTVPVAMGASLGGGFAVQWGLLAAIETLYLIPVVLVTFLLQNQLLRGVTFGTIRQRVTPA